MGRQRVRMRRAGALLAAAGLAALAMTGSAAAPAGAASTAAAARTPGVWGWGSNNYGQVGNGTYGELPTPVTVTMPGPVAQLAAGSEDSAAVLTDGRLATWGGAFYCLLGSGASAPERSVPTVLPGLTGMVQAAIGLDHVLALGSAGTVWSWGTNAFGQLGNGTTSSVSCPGPVPVPVPGLTGITQVSAGLNFSLARKSDGTVWAGGRERQGPAG
ncbi:MAG TPA: hypothetical protein VGG35_25885 [Streptosporangiaceae bacterium]